MAELTRDGALLVDTFGTELLEYLCAAEPGAVARRIQGEERLSQRAEEVLTQLLGFATQLAAVAAEDRVPVALRLDVLGRFDERAQTSVGNALRLHAGGDVDLGIPDDHVAGPLVLLLRDTFPLLLVPPERTLFARPHLAGAIWSSPHRKAFEEAVMSDSDLSRLFVQESKDGGWKSMVYRSTGSGGTLQLWGFPDLLLTSAWWQGRVTDDLARESLAATVVDLVDLLRRAVRGETCEVKALVAFTGIVLDGVDEIPLPFGILRPVRDHERPLAPPSLEGTVMHTMADGGTVTASYAGDVVLETRLPYRLAVEKPNASDFTAWPQDLRGYERLEADIETIRLATLLTGSTDVPLTLVPTWRLTLDPLSFGPQLSWSDARAGPSLAPRRITDAAAGELRTWAETIHAKRHGSVEVAVRRTLSALASRVDPVDAVVDLVIAWENLFGSSQGEPTLRVSASLAWLLGSNPAEREEFRAKASRIYALRSQIVHGNRAVAPEKVVDALATARSITWAALRRLFEERAELLALANGDERSRALMMGE